MNRKLELFQQFFINRDDRIAVKTEEGIKSVAPTPSPLEQVLLSHLEGTPACATTPYSKILEGPFRVGVYALSKENTALWLCFDIDGGLDHSTPIKDTLSVARTISNKAGNLGIPAYLEMSKSSAGYHVWIFFENPVPGRDARRLARTLLPEMVELESGKFVPGVDAVEIFPKQDALSPGGFGSQVFLPWYSGASSPANRFCTLEDDGSLKTINIETFETLERNKVVELVSQADNPTEYPVTKQPNETKRGTNVVETGPNKTEWRQAALTALDLNDVYGDYLTGKKNGQWLECRDPQSPTGDRTPSAGVADGSDDIEKGRFKSFIRGEDEKPMSVFDFLIEESEAADFQEACDLIAQYSNVPLPTSLSPNGSDDSKGLPTIIVNNRQMPEVFEEALDALLQANEPPTLFQREGRMICVEGKMGERTIALVSEDALKGRLYRSARWMRREGKEINHARPPVDVVKDLMSKPQPRFPELERVVSHPVFSPKGELLSSPGYHSESRLFLDIDDIDHVPRNPTEADIQNAKDLLFADLLVDFPFDSNPSKANYLAALLLPFVRPMIDGPTPLHVIEAPVAGSGKSMLSSMISRIALGSNGNPMTLPANEEEARKKITATLLSGPSVIFIDNMDEKRSTVGQALSSVLTTSNWTDRLLGKTEMVRMPNKALWLMTGNNPSFSLEMARRVVKIRIDPRTDRPWQRGGFKHHDLEAWTDRNRNRLIIAILTLIQSWASKGRPAGSATLGSYEEWARVMSGILGSIGVEGFLINQNELYEEADAEGEAWREFASMWWEQYGDEPKKVGDLITLCEEKELMESIRGDGSPQSQRTRLGNALNRSKDRVYDGYFIRREKKGNRISYRLEAKNSNDMKHHKETSGQTTDPEQPDDDHVSTLLDEYGFGERSAM